MKQYRAIQWFPKVKYNTKYGEYYYKDKDFTISQLFPELCAQEIESYNVVRIFSPKLENKYHKTSFQG